MGRPISDEVKEQINELYAEIGVKSKVAKILGISTSSVSKYILPNYIPKSQRITSECSVAAGSIDLNFIKQLDGAAIAKYLIQLSPDEKADLEELQKEIYL